MQCTDESVFYSMKNNEEQLNTSTMWKVIQRRLQDWNWERNLQFLAALYSSSLSFLCGP
jgi:serine acetyltransferase